MRASKKAIISLLVGAALGVIYMIAVPQDIGYEESVIGYYAAGLFISMLMGFGYAFGWTPLKKVLGTFLGITVNATIIAIFARAFSGSREDSNPMTGLIVTMFFLTILALGWIPGIFIGAYALAKELIVYLSFKNS